MLSSQKWAFFLIQLFFLILLFPGFKTEAEEESLTVTPETLEIRSTPNQVISNHIQVINRTDQDQQVDIITMDVEPTEEEGEVTPTQKTDLALTPWLQINPKTLSLAAKSAGFIELTITVPADAQPRARLGAIVAKNQSGEEQASLILLDIPGEIARAHVASFRAEQLIAFRPAQLVVRIKNETKTYFKFAGEVKIYDLFGRELSTLPIDPKNVLPQSIRRAEVSWKEAFGLYRAEFKGSIDKNQSELAATTFFLALDSPPLIVLLLSLLTLGAVLLFLKWRRNV